MSFDDFARRAIRKSKYRDKKRAERAAADKKAADKAIANGATVDTGWHASLSAAQKWAIENPDNAKVDNDGNPVTSEHWGFEPPKGNIDPHPSH
jgi:hypothetical protein